MEPARPNCFLAGYVEYLHSPFCRSLKVFLFQGRVKNQRASYPLIFRPALFHSILSASRWSLNRKLFRARVWARNENERSAVKKQLFVTLALAGLSVVSSFNAHATLVREKFATDPAQDGWQIYGDTNLFHWDPVNHNLAVTWDSTQTNSYFYHPLDRTYTTNDSFCVQFDLTLTNELAIGYFQIAVGLCNLAEATGPGFSRANAVSPDLFEFDYYPDGPESYGPSIDATLIDSGSNFYFTYDASQPLPTYVTCHVLLIHEAGTSTISGTVFTNGQVMTTLPVTLAYGAAGFQLGTLAVENYTTLDDTYGDSLFAQGSVANLSFASPLPVGLVRATAAGQVQLNSDTNWLYTLEQTTDFQTWTAAAPAVFGSGTNLLLQATDVPAGKSFYRVRADLP